MEAKMLARLRTAVVGVFILAVLAGLFLPVYTDEIGWRFNSRAAVDGVDKLYADTCGPNTLAVPPFFMMPARYFSAVLTNLFPDPLYIRLGSIFYALLWSGMLLALIRRIAPGARDRAVLPIVAFGLLALGTLPLLLIWSRPEQPILIATIGALLIAWSDRRDPATATGPTAAETRDTPARQAWLRSLAVLAMAVLAASYHLKGAFLAPVFLACLFFASRGRAAIAPRWVIAALIMVVALWTLHYWANRMACPDDPIIRAGFNQQSVGTDILRARNLSDMLAAIGKLLSNVTPWSYFRIPVPRLYPMSDWLPPQRIDPDLSIYWYFMLFGCWGLGGILLTACAAVSSLRAVRARRLDRGVAITLALALVVLAWTGMQISRNVYDASFILPMMVLAIVVGLATHGGEGRMRVLVNVLVFPLSLFAIASPLAIAASYGPYMARAAGERGYLRDQDFSQSVFHYDEMQRETLAAAKLCGFTDFSKTRALLIDDVTYLPTIASPLPQHFIGVVGEAKGSIKDPVAYLKSRGSSGAVLSCSKLPDNLRARAKRYGQICCLAAPEW